MATKNTKKKTTKKLAKSSKEKMISGVIGGIANYTDLDPTILRITWLVVTAFTGFLPGIIVYIGSALVMPQGN